MHQKGKSIAVLGIKWSGLYKRPLATAWQHNNDVSSAEGSMLSAEPTTTRKMTK